MFNPRSSTIRRLHGLLGVISALNLLLLTSTGLLLQHMNNVRLDERTVSRRFLPANYRPQDGAEGVRADIVITDLHSGKIVGPVGTVILDAITLGWLVLLCTGLVMYVARSNSVRNGNNGRNGGNSNSNGGSKRFVESGTPQLTLDTEKRERESTGRVTATTSSLPQTIRPISECCPAVCPLAGQNVAVMHLTGTELRRALHAVEHLWTKRVGPATSKTTLVVCAYRCPDGHCHLICQSPVDLCRTEQSALVLLDVMTGIPSGQNMQLAGLPIAVPPERGLEQVV